jgi:hypothetical protein
MRSRPRPGALAAHRDRAVAEAFVIAHAAPGAWADGTAVKYRQTPAALGTRLAGSGPAADIAVLGTLPGAVALEAAFTAAFGTLASATGGV